MDVYHEHVLDHYRRPRNSGSLADATVRFDDSNPLCGDRVHVDLKVEDGVVRSARFSASGCAVSQAGASMLFERLEGMAVSAVLALDKQTILDEFGSALSVSRVKCALLALSAVKKALMK